MIMSNRNEKTSTHLTPEVRTRLHIEADRQRKSVSHLIFVAVVEYLQRHGHQVTEEVKRA